MAGVTSGRTTGGGTGKAARDGPPNTPRSKRKGGGGRKRASVRRGLCHKCFRSNVEITLDGFAKDDPNNDGRPRCLDCAAHMHGMRQAAKAAPG